ncbi:type I-C CRISPR-associated protein Cas8c/Csd1 [Chelativorans sp. Marseille-P2723]|uniref:type I-C CRISPR-associated protein Cas8c/Csd1 n=1 Tax=Chelativorans sp. Marseille-P2723 TaxID=2709133 RepID=UPI0015705AEE|nr:type I-C CRISPR-associated protein Cas8c/Csd1 [Chelativorans sp. Marseille-P2723]
MSILAALVQAYDRLDRLGMVPPFGFSSERIGFVISLNEDGSVASVTDLRSGEGKRKTSRMMEVPQPVKRTVAITPNFLWDKTSYVLGVTAGEGKRVADEHAAFKQRHLETLETTADTGLKALRLFLESWTPDKFTEPLWPDDMKDQNVVFALESERRQNCYLHDRPAAKELWAQIASSNEGRPQVCLVSGVRGPVARLHPAIKGVWGAQSSGASIVSFNLDAFTSYGHSQGDNSPVSEFAAFKYTAALNALLASSNHRLQIGDTSTVFWAVAPDDDTAKEAESLVLAMFSEVDEESEAQKVGTILKRMRRGVPLREIAPRLATSVRFYVLGLAPNAARLSIRFWFEDDFGRLAENMQDYYQDILLEPSPSNTSLPSIRRCELRTAPASRDSKSGKLQFDPDRISPLLAGELLRAILTGSKFPSSLLSLLLMRVRSDGVLDHMRAALIKAVITRILRFDKRLPLSADGSPMEEYLMRFDPDDPSPARRLGRLFALIERAQSAALGGELNVTVADKFLGAASATPGRVLHHLIRNARNHHIKRLRNGHSAADWVKDTEHARRLASSLERDIGLLTASFADGFPQQLSAEEQGLFLIGYYQERYGSKDTAADNAENNEDMDLTGEE